MAKFGACSVLWSRGPLTDRYLALPLPRTSWAAPHPPPQPTSSKISLDLVSSRNAHLCGAHSLQLCGVFASSSPELTGLPWYSWGIPDLSPQWWESRATCALSPSSWCCGLYVWIGWRKTRVFRDAKLSNKSLAYRAAPSLWTALPRKCPSSHRMGSVFSAESWFLSSKKVAVGAVW